MTIPNLTSNNLDENIKILKLKFIEIIRNKLGIVLHSHQTQDLIKIIHEACEKFKCTPDEYLTLLIESPNQSTLLNHLISGITVGETYFFRDKQQMELLEKELLPQIIKNKREQNNLSIRIWSAGCASGEEIYTIAMLLIELIPDIQQWTIKLLATDINTNALQKGIAGLYSEWSMRSISNYFKEQYFEKKDKNYQLIKKVINLVTFDYLNLNDESYPSLFNGTNSQDLILCRNVLIYFDNESIVSLMRRLNECLILNGYLMLGASDPINIAGMNFIFHHQKGLIFSRSLLEQKEISPALPIISPHIKSQPIKKRFIQTKKIQKKEIASKTNESLSEMAVQFANEGKLVEAAQLCEKSFQLDPTNKFNYFTYALTLLEMNKLDEAESSLRKSLFLDNKFVVGHFQLGLLLIRKKQFSAGLKYLQNALAIAETKKPKDPVLGSPGLNYQKFAEILRNEMNLYKTADIQHEK